MKKLLLSLLSICSIGIYAQIQLGDQWDFSVPKEYIIGGVTVIGSENTEVRAIKLFAGLSEGNKVTIPGDDITKAIKNLWKQDLFSHVAIKAADVRGETIFLIIEVEERPRLGAYSYKGVRKSTREDLREIDNITPGRILNENVLSNAQAAIRNYFIDKGYLKAKIEFQERFEPINDKELLVLDIFVKKGNRYKINNIDISGAETIKPSKLKKAMKDTKERKFYRVFNRSKFIKSSYKADKKKILALYNGKGYRNAKILTDTVYDHDKKSINIDIKVKEGNKFYFRNITWLGNTKYTEKELSDRLNITKGDIFNKNKLDERLFMSPNGGDVSSLYLDNGYLSFQANPIEILVENDSIDIEVRIYEGKQYRVNQVIIKGNTLTNDHVIMREIRTKPGDLFSRTDIIRTQRELVNLGYFDPEGLGVNPIQNPVEGTVDIEYTVAERPSDQIELSGGWGAGRVVGTLGLSFNNFSLRNVFNKSAWRPVPKGDGQRFTIRAQSNGSFFQAYSASFIEPWLGGKKPNSLSFSLQHSVQTNGRPKTIVNSDGERVDNPDRQSLKISGGSVGLGKRLRVPDDFFILSAGISYQHYTLDDFGSIFTFSNGESNNFSLTTSFTRNSVSSPIFPTYGSDIGITLKLTPPYSLWDGVDNYNALSEQDKYRWIEYHKWKFTAAWYTTLAGAPNLLNNSGSFSRKLVLSTKIGFGYLGNYNQSLGDAPFERFYLGGSALTGFTLDGREIISLRGYDDLTVSPDGGATYITKYTAELRYPLSTNPNATIYTLGFVEAGNTWISSETYNPFQVKRSAGVGLRIFLPMFGLMGLDYGWRFDDIPAHPNIPRSQFHFTIGANLGEL